MRKYQKMQAIIMCAALAASSMSVLADEVSYPLTLTGTDGTEITIDEEPEKIVSMGEYDRDFVCNWCR